MGIYKVTIRDKIEYTYEVYVQATSEQDAKDKIPDMPGFRWDKRATILEDEDKYISGEVVSAEEVDATPWNVTLWL